MKLEMIAWGADWEKESVMARGAWLISLGP
jgi:hypothetical protein